MVASIKSRLFCAFKVISDGEGFKNWLGDLSRFSSQKLIEWTLRKAWRSRWKAQEDDKNSRRMLFYINRSSKGLQDKWTRRFLLFVAQLQRTFSGFEYEKSERRMESRCKCKNDGTNSSLKKKSNWSLIALCWRCNCKCFQDFSLVSSEIKSLDVIKSVYLFLLLYTHEVFLRFNRLNSCF